MFLITIHKIAWRSKETYFTVTENLLMHRGWYMCYVRFVLFCSESYRHAVYSSSLILFLQGHLVRWITKTANHVIVYTNTVNTLIATLFKQQTFQKCYSISAIFFIDPTNQLLSVFSISALKSTYFVSEFSCPVNQMHLRII